MRRPLAPLWMAGATRFAGASRIRAGLAAGALLLLLIAAMATPGPMRAPDAPAGIEHTTDVVTYDGIIEGIRAGGNYYQLAADTLRAGADPVRPFVTFRLPLHSVVQARLPRFASLLLLFLLVVAVMVAWWKRLAPLFRRGAPRAVAMVLLAGGTLAFVQPDRVGLHESWAAPLVALSLALRRPGRWVEAVALALIALLVRETAVLYVLAMAGMAWVDGERREAAGWGAAMGMFALVLGVHAHAVAQVTGPLDPITPMWNVQLGLGFFLDAVAQSTVLAAAPTPLALLLGVLCFAGWTAATDPLSRRVAAVVATYAAAISLFARAETFHWAMMIAPMFLVGLAFLPDLARDLGHAILDRPRVRVQRVSR